MFSIKRNKYNLIFVVFLIFILSVLIKIYAGINVQVAFLDSALGSLQVGYNLIQFSTASNPFIFLSNLLDAVIFPMLTVILAALFFDFISNVNLRERLVFSKLNRMSGHVIVVPFNSFSKSLIKEMKSSGIKYVTIAENKKELMQLYKENELAIEGDLRSIETFETANIKKAKYLIACSKDDLQNALISMTAKTSNPNIKIIAKVNKEENMNRLESAGAYKTIMTESAAGEDIGNEITKRVLSKRGLKSA